ncbi:MAG: MipA/OmpV family protein [Rhodanobacter sp.]
MIRTFPSATRLPRLALCVALLTCLWTSACMADTDSQPTWAAGVGVEHLPSWAGAKNSRYQWIPYVDVEIPNRLSLSTEDGLQIDLIGGSELRGGIYGDYQWGRESDEVGTLRHRIKPLSPRLTLGGYLEWQLSRQVDIGSDLSHDTQGAGTYLKLYGEWDLPPVGVLQHSLQLSWQAMNGAAMQRYFGISPVQAGELNVPPWQPAAGSELATLEYDLFVPTSKHTGFALAVIYGRLLGDAGDSSLVTRFGSRTQWNESIAFVYHR